MTPGQPDSDEDERERLRQELSDTRSEAERLRAELDEFKLAAREMRSRAAMRSREARAEATAARDRAEQAETQLARVAADLTNVLRRAAKADGSAAGLSQSAFRIVFISGEPFTPGHTYRVARPAAAAARLGAAATVVRADEILRKLDEIGKADVLLIWRAPWSDALAQAVQTARANSAKIVFDVDDLMVDPDLAKIDVIDGIRSMALTESGTRSLYQGIRRTMAIADFCTTTTEELAAHMRRAHVSALVLRNAFDEANIVASRLAVRRRAATGSDGLVRIGYAGGSRTHQRDFAVCADAVAAVLRDRPAYRLVLFRPDGDTTGIVDIGEFPQFRGLEAQIEWRSYVPLPHLCEELARFDVNLAPLEVGNPFCEAKSELKVFEAALVNVPTVASPTGPYGRAIEHEVTGFLARSAEEWRVAILRLADDPGLRRNIARAAEFGAYDRFGPDRQAQDIGVLLALAQGGRTAGEAFSRRTRRAPATVAPKIAAAETAFSSDRLGIAEVSVVIPLFNYAEYIVEALESVRLQSLDPLDLIVVDDCSTDNSLAVALEWMKANAARFGRAILLRNRVNSKLGATRNAAFAAAETPFVLPLDADNRLLPDCCGECLSALRDSSAHYAYPLIRQFGGGSDLMGVRGYDPLRLTVGNYIDAMALVSKSAWATVGGYASSPEIPEGWEDFDLWCRFAEEGFWGKQVGLAPLAEYRVHPASMIKANTGDPDRLQKMMEEFEARHPWVRHARPALPPRS